MAIHTLKFVWCEHDKIFKECLAIFKIIHEMAKKLCIVFQVN